MPATFKAAVLEEFRTPIAVREFPLLQSVEPAGVLVRVQMAGVCGTDVHLWKGQLSIPRPNILGHETVGIIEQCGEALQHDWHGLPLRKGDRITWSSSLACGHCFYCKEKRQPTRCLNRKAYGISYNCNEPPHCSGGYAEFIYLRPGTAIFKLDDPLSTERVIGAGCALVTAIHGIERLGMNWGDVVVIQGAGPVGLAALAVALGHGASRVILIGGPEARLKTARRFGAAECLDIEALPSAEKRIQRVRELTRGYGADVVIECVGSPEVVPEAIEMCRDGAKLLVLGHYGDAGEVSINPHHITRKQLQLQGSWGSEPRHMAQALEFLRDRGDHFPFEELVTHRFSLERAMEAIETTQRWQSTKSVVVP
ncbi:MAG: zinc-binding dehydrogenase [Acidimicrobiia bacterium]|nr:zinc-binding dehydrogenase [Acidimicrobiia bacterium]